MSSTIIHHLIHHLIIYYLINHLISLTHPPSSPMFCFYDIKVWRMKNTYKMVDCEMRDEMVVGEMMVDEIRIWSIIICLPCYNLSHNLPSHPNLRDGSQRGDGKKRDEHERDDLFLYDMVDDMVNCVEEKYSSHLPSTILPSLTQKQSHQTCHFYFFHIVRSIDHTPYQWEMVSLSDDEFPNEMVNCEMVSEIDIINHKSIISVSHNQSSLISHFM